MFAVTMVCSHCQHSFLYSIRGVVGPMFFFGGGKGSIFPTNSIGKKKFPDKNILIYLPPPSTVKKFSGQERYNCFRSTFSELALGEPAYYAGMIPTTSIFRRVSTIGGHGPPCPPPPATAPLYSMYFIIQTSLNL